MDKDELLQRAEFGRQVELFWGSRLGEYLRDRAAAVYTAANEELQIVDPEDAKKIRKLQNDIYRVKSLETWLSEVVQDGIAALDILSGESEE